jgi:hypothetical protein
MRKRTMAGQNKVDYRNPQIRRFRSGKASPEIIQPLNRSAAIRQILHEHGIDIPLASIKNHLLRWDYKLPKDRTILNVRLAMKKSLLPKDVAQAQDVIRLARRLIRATGSVDAAIKTLKAA